MCPEEPHQITIDTVYIAKDLGWRSDFDHRFRIVQDLDHFVTQLLDHVLLNRKAVVVGLSQELSIQVVAKCLA